MKKGTCALLSVCLMLACASGALAGKRDGASCRGDKSCNSRICEVAPGARTGTCCVRDTCDSVSGCGTFSDGCAGQLECGGCAGGFDCESNSCSTTTMCGGWPVIYDAYPEGSYEDYCFGCSVGVDCNMICFCRPTPDTWQSTSIEVDECDPQTSDIASIDGNLTCVPLQ